MLEKKVVSQCISSDYCRGWNDAVDAMPRWISVEDRLPEAKELYLVCGNHWIAGSRPIITTALWLGDRWDRDSLFEITHWMPMPEPPKED